MHLFSFGTHGFIVFFNLGENNGIDFSDYSYSNWIFHLFDLTEKRYFILCLQCTSSWHHRIYSVFFHAWFGETDWLTENCFHLHRLWCGGKFSQRYFRSISSRCKCACANSIFLVVSYIRPAGLGFWTYLMGTSSHVMRSSRPLLLL